MFKLFKKKGINIFSPLNGEVIELAKVNDPVFSQKMMGEGFAVIPSDSTVYSPTVGIIKSIFPTKHAISISSDDGTEILLHIGIDTVSLEGKGLYPKVFEGQSVAIGDPLLVIDLQYLKEQGKEDTVIVVFPELKGKQVSISNGFKEVGDKVATIK
ncbi:PTS glucose transporter subunit IIA [Enterococcus gallinarum]|uniref:PTS sugar transporter subunit IIA n=1 Tax=Enterococcus gallinarum TaxID=1353 RepID=UPI002090F7AB|nr:PTS glucose transporter subunit IIA [Enterococcus gallinarum]